MKKRDLRSKETQKMERIKEVVDTIYCDVERKCEVKRLASQEVPFRTMPVWIEE